MTEKRRKGRTSPQALHRASLLRTSRGEHRPDRPVHENRFLATRHWQVDSKRLGGVRVVSSPLKRLSFPPVPSKSKPKAWTFKENQALIEEFCKRMDPDLPFYYWTLNEHYSEDAYPSFDARPDFDEDEVELRNLPLRLHRLRHSQREDSAIFVVGRAHPPARDRQSIRQSFHRPGNYLALPPSDI